MDIKLRIIFYSMYGYTYKMTEAVAKGAKAISDVEVELFRVPELVATDILQTSGAAIAQKAFAHIPIISAHQTAGADAYIFGAPTRFGNLCAQMRHFLEQLGTLCTDTVFVNKIGSIFTNTANPQNGQDITLTAFHHTLLHLGMIIVPFNEKRRLEMPETENNIAYKPSRLSNNNENNIPTENELALAYHQGKQVAEITRAYKLGKHLKT